MSEWRDFATKHYEEMKKSNPNTKFGDALKAAAKKWKKSKKGGDGEAATVTSETNTENKPETKPENATENKSESEPVTATETKSESETGAASESKPVSVDTTEQKGGTCNAKAPSQRKLKRGGKNTCSQRKSKRKNRKSRRTHRR